MFKEKGCMNVSMVEAFGGFFIKEGKPVPVRLQNRLSLAMMQAKAKLKVMSSQMNVL